MTQHKWHKEIKAWADGKKVYGRMNTHKSLIAEGEVKKLSEFDLDNYSFYIKPQPKEPQYLYVSKGDNGKPELSFIDHQESIGKIKLESDDDMQG